MKGLTYWLHLNRLYIGVTNKLVCESPIVLRGPSFVLPANSFERLPDGIEPTSEQMANVSQSHITKMLEEVPV